jgi:site-specific DNA recombinase
MTRRRFYLNLTRQLLAWPALGDRDTFKRVQAMLKERAFVTTHPKRVASNYLLSGLAKCGYCGKSLIGQDAKGGRFHYYVCGTLQKKGSGSCPARYISSNKLEQVVISKIKEHILTYENLKELVKLVNEEIDTADGDY